MTTATIDEAAEAEVRQEQVQEQASDLVRQARELTIETAAEYEAAGAFLVSVKAVRKEIANVFDPMIKAAHESHKVALAQKKEVEKPAIEAERVAKRAIADFDRRQEAERLRLEQEAREKARREAEDRQVEKAAELERQGRTAEADAVLDRPTPTEVPMPAAAPPKAAGVSVRKAWGFRVIDEQAVARSFLQLDEKKIRQVVRSMGPDAAQLVGGIEVYEKRTVAAASK